MRAGLLRERVTIQSKTSVSDGEGGRTPTWSTLATVWAQVEPLRMGERLQANALGSALTWRVVMRYRADVTPQMRLQWTPRLATAAKTLEVHGVQPHATDRHGLVLECSEVI